LGAWEGKEKKGKEASGVSTTGRICAGFKVLDGGVGLRTDGLEEYEGCIGMLEIAVIEPVCEI
jgi:hypothetical protein